MSIMLMEFLPCMLYLRHSEVSGYAQFRSLEVAVTHPDGVAHKLSLFVMAEHDRIALVLHLVAVTLPSELVKLTEGGFASIVYLVSVAVAYILRQFPSAALVDDVSGHPATLTNLVVVVHMTVHIHAVHYDMQMWNAGFTIDV